MHVMDRSSTRASGLPHPSVPRRWGRSGVIALAVAALVAAPGLASAAPPCRVTVAGSLVFGTYDVFSATPLDTSVLVQLTCPAAQAPQVLISKGNSTTYAARELRAGTDALRYNLFLDPGFTRVWGDGTEGSSVWAPPKGNAQTTIWARVPGNQDAAAGAYSDTLVVTVFL